MPVSEIAAAVNAWGLRHMHGNVWEWCEDGWHDNYEMAPEDGTSWIAMKRRLFGGPVPDTDARRVVRGGSWGDYPQLLRSALRDRDGPGFRYSDRGFRLARTLLTP